ncbi:hypothetical protein LCGC14_1003300 [marine sediment metagenome]|uniref:Uncharacterized protein n=1 Tax=marine sediment metagenome TaxID=412755 RepID=A0A0F9NNV3_9ZZZZ
MTKDTDITVAETADFEQVHQGYLWEKVELALTWAYEHIQQAADMIDDGLDDEFLTETKRLAELVFQLADLADTNSINTFNSDLPESAVAVEPIDLDSIPKPDTPEGEK